MKNTLSRLFFFWGGRGVFVVVDGHDSCFKENCMISGRYDKADSIVALEYKSISHHRIDLCPRI